MNQNKRGDLGDKLFKLREALVYAKLAHDLEKINSLKMEIAEVLNEIKTEDINRIKR